MTDVKISSHNSLAYTVMDNFLTELKVTKCPTDQQVGGVTRKQPDF